MIKTSIEKGHRDLTIKVSCECTADVLRLQEYFLAAKKSAIDPGGTFFFNQLAAQAESCLPVKDNLPIAYESEVQREFRESSIKSAETLHNLEVLDASQGNPSPEVLHERLKDVPPKEWTVQKRRLDTEEIVTETDPFHSLDAAKRHKEAMEKTLTEHDRGCFIAVMPVTE